MIFDFVNMKLVSTIRGKLRQNADAIEVVKACFPGG